MTEVNIIPDWTKRNYIVSGTNNRRQAIISRELGSKKWSMTVVKIHKGVIKQATVKEVSPNKAQLLAVATLYVANGDKTIDDFVNEIDSIPREMEKIAKYLNGIKP